MNVPGDNGIEAVLRRLERLTEDEARMTVVQTLEVVHGLVRNTRMVMDGEQLHYAYFLPAVEFSSPDSKASVDNVRDALGTFCRSQ
jgi:hypothetical protein